MAKVPIVPDQVEARKVLSPERYLLEVQKAAIGKSPKGNTTLKLEMVVIDGPEQTWGSPNGFNVTKTVWVDPKSRDLQNTLEAFEIPVGPDGWDPDDFVAKQAWGSVVNRLYDGDPVTDVRKFFPVESA
jgi:hypothetical protein